MFTFVSHLNNNNMNVLEKIAKVDEESIILGLKVSDSLSLSIYDDTVGMSESCILLFRSKIIPPSIMHKLFKVTEVGHLLYFNHPEFSTTFVFTKQSN